LFGVSDIVEPNEPWRQFKRESTGREWDYVFRRLFFTWSDNIVEGQFHAWIPIADREATAGFLFPNDLFVHSDGQVSLLWTDTAVDARLRDRFFPSARQRTGLDYAKVRDGQVMQRGSVLHHHEGKGGPIPGRSRFHVSPEGRLWIFHHFEESGPQNALVEVGPEETLCASLPVSLRIPLVSFFTNSVRAGCAPSSTLDILGQSGNAMRYARIALP
jgi:hypothetical protein